MKTIANYVWIKPIKPEVPKTDSGIILQVNAAAPQTGYVTYIGLKCNQDLLVSDLGPVEIGTKVLFDKDHIRRAGENNEYIIIPDRNILAVIPE